MLIESPTHYELSRYWDESTVTLRRGFIECGSIHSKTMKLLFWPKNSLVSFSNVNKGQKSPLRQRQSNNDVLPHDLLIIFTAWRENLMICLYQNNSQAIFQCKSSFPESHQTNPRASPHKVTSAPTSQTLDFSCGQLCFPPHFSLQQLIRLFQPSTCNWWLRCTPQ